MPRSMWSSRRPASSAARRWRRMARCARRAGVAVGFIEKPYCERLGTPFAYDLGVPGLQSPEAIANPPVYQRARAVARFEDGPVRDLIHRLKYGDRMELAKPLGLWMARAGAELACRGRSARAGAVASAPADVAAVQSGAMHWRKSSQAQAARRSIPLPLRGSSRRGRRSASAAASAPTMCRALSPCRRRRPRRSRAARSC